MTRTACFRLGISEVSALVGALFGCVTHTFMFGAHFYSSRDCFIGVLLDILCRGTHAGSVLGVGLF